MSKLWINLSILAVLVLTACGQAAPAGLDPTAPPVQPTSAEPTEALVPTEDASAVKMECQVVSIAPTQEPTLKSAFPPPTSEDWTLGNTSDPNLTIIEYSDFQ